MTKRTKRPERPRRKRPARTYARALEAAISLYQNDKRISEALVAGEGVDWAKSFVAITADPDLGELVGKLLIRDPDSPRCMIWNGAVDAHGYPRVRAFGMLRPTVRVVWQLLTHEPLQPNVIIRMTCGTRLCISPKHMRPDYKVGSRAKLTPPPDATIPPKGGGAG